MSMSTAIWSEVNTLSSSVSSLQEPRRSAPPIMQQPQVKDEVVWDDSMMELDDYHYMQEVPSTKPEIDPIPQEIETVDVGNDSATKQPDSTDPSQVRPDAIHLRGVDNLSTDDVKLYASTIYPSSDFKVEWIDDTSLNIVFHSLEIATSALLAFSSPHIEELPPTTLRPAKPLTGEKTIEGLKVRIALMGDKKERGARDRSRWYLFNPPPAELERHRPYSPKATVNNSRRDSRWRGDRRYDPYPRRRRSRSTSRSPPLNYDEPPRNEGVELFPYKVSGGPRPTRSRDSRSRSPARRERAEDSNRYSSFS